MKKDNKNKSPLLDVYIQRQKQESKFEVIEDEKIANAIRTLLYKDGKIPRNLN